jgi:Mn2+/Fe2+ NRAMP family transporter
VILGCIITDVVAFFIVVACAATIYRGGHHQINDVAEAASALAPFAGKFAAMLFALGLINASLMSAAILPLATSYNICEGLGFESGIDHKFREAPVFYGLYTALIVGGSVFVLIPGIPLLKVILLSQVANGILLPFVLTFMLLLVNRPRLMGEYRNRLPGNLIAGLTSVVMIGLTVALVWTSIFP